MVKLSIIFNIVTIILVLFLFVNKNKKKKEEEVKTPVTTISASKLFNSILSDDNTLAANRGEQPLNPYGDIGNFTTFDSVDYELERHINTYNIEDWLDKTDTSLTVKSTMDYVSATA